MKSIRQGLLLGVVSLVAVSIGCKKESAAAGGPPPGGGGNAPASPVRVITVESKTSPVEFVEIGKTVASRRVEVRARIAGYLKKRHFEEGAYVKEGQLLYEIDPEQYQVSLKEAEADLEKAQANLELAQRDVDRITPLVTSKVVSQKDLDDAEARRKSSSGEVASSKARIERAKLDLGYTKVYSPVSGIVGFTQKQEGAYVDDLNNSLLVETMQMDPMYVNFSIPERTMLRYKADAAAGRMILPENKDFTMVLEMLDGSHYEKTGRLTITGFEVNPTTGTAIFRAEVPNPDGKLIDGQFVKVHAQGAVRPNVISVPQRAIIMGEQGPFVYVVADGKAAIRPVTLGDMSIPNWIINDGLKAGDVVITDGTQKIGPGAPVAIQDTAQATPVPAPAPPPATPASQPAAAAAR